MPRTIALLLVAPLLFASAYAAADSYYPVPSEYVRVSGEATTIDTPLLRDTFVPGLGWLSGSPAGPPVSRGGAFYVDEENRDRFALTARPAVPPPVTEEAVEGAGAAAAVRFGGEAEVRVVVDLPALPSAAPLAGLAGEGVLQEGDALALDLPRVELPPEQPDPYRGVDVTLLELAESTRLEVRGPTMGYRVFALEAPTRLVIDLVPLRRSAIPTKTETLLDGVVYQTFGAPTPSGPSRVHLLEIAPGAGEFRVVGADRVGQPLSELADGAFAAINAGYFDTSTFRTIGLLRVDYGLQSLPSRNRASIGFGLQGTVMDRVRARVKVRIDGRLYLREEELGDDALQVHSVPGALAGVVSRGALAVQRGHVIANRVGPVTVPEDGFVVTYPPEHRALALVEPGSRAVIEVDFEPDIFETVRYAVEAGPLLVAEGQPALDPEREQFARGQRILDAYTQQSAIGVRADGTVLFVVADDMRAEDLVPLFIGLGAEYAMRLDSGSSATLFADGRVLNRARERRIVSAIVFLPSGS